MKAGKLEHLDRQFKVTKFLTPQLGGPNAITPQMSLFLIPDHFERVAESILSMAIRPFSKLDLDAKSSWEAAEVDPVDIRYHKPIVDWRHRYLPQFVGDGTVYQVIVNASACPPGCQFHSWAPTDQQTSVGRLMGIVQWFYSHANPKNTPAHSDWGLRNTSEWMQWSMVYILKASWAAKDPTRRSYEIYKIPDKVLKKVDARYL